MMSFLHEAFERKAVKHQYRELQQFIDSLSAMPSDELGLVVACATHVRHQLKGKGIDVLRPTIQIHNDAMTSFKLSQMIKQMQQENRPVDAAAMMVWLHTVRAMYQAGKLVDLQTLAQEMWRQLQRGFDYVERASANFETLTGIHLNTDSYGDFPDGLNPREANHA